jgi:hypothetical protein
MAAIYLRVPCSRIGLDMALYKGPWCQERMKFDLYLYPAVMRKIIVSLVFLLRRLSVDNPLRMTRWPRMPLRSCMCNTSLFRYSYFVCVAKYA